VGTGFSTGPAPPSSCVAESGTVSASPATPCSPPLAAPLASGLAGLCFSLAVAAFLGLAVALVAAFAPPTLSCIACFCPLLPAVPQFSVLGGAAVGVDVFLMPAASWMGFCWRGKEAGVCLGAESRAGGLAVPRIGTSSGRYAGFCAGLGRAGRMYVD
jgi:hypothetical protein